MGLMESSCSGNTGVEHYGTDGTPARGICENFWDSSSGNMIIGRAARREQELEKSSTILTMSMISTSTTIRGPR